MELENKFILKQFVAIDELKPSYISSAMDEFCEVYARAVLKLLFLLTDEMLVYGVPQRQFFFNLKNRAAFGSLERSNIVGICVMKWCGADVELETFHYKGQSYCLSAYYGNVLHPERKWVTVSRIPLTDIVLWEQIYNCLCREYEEVRHKH